MIVKLLTEHHLEFLSLKGGCRGSFESTLVKMSNCWKSHAAAHFLIAKISLISSGMLSLSINNWEFINYILCTISNETFLLHHYLFLLIKIFF